MSVPRANTPSHVSDAHPSPYGTPLCIMALAVYCLRHHDSRIPHFVGCSRSWRSLRDHALEQYLQCYVLYHVCLICCSAFRQGALELSILWLTRKEVGLFTREEWQDISGCCLCRVEGSELRNLNLWENPRAGISIPPQVHSVLDRGAM
jgi:hypothetical protein